MEISNETKYYNFITYLFNNYTVSYNEPVT